MILREFKSNSTLLFFENPLREKIIKNNVKNTQAIFKNSEKAKIVGQNYNLLVKI